MGMDDHFCSLSGNCRLKPAQNWDIGWCHEAVSDLLGQVRGKVTLPQALLVTIPFFFVLLF